MSRPDWLARSFVVVMASLSFVNTLFIGVISAGSLHAQLASLAGVALDPTRWGVAGANAGVLVSDVTDSTASISWVTGTSTAVTSVEVADPSNTNFDNDPEDPTVLTFTNDLGNGYTHLFRLSGLDAFGSPTVLVRVNSGGSALSTFALTLGASITPPPPNPFSGQVVDPNGAPVANALVYVRIFTGSTPSARTVALTASDGTFVVDLTSIRTASLDAFHISNFATWVSSSSDNVEIVVEGGRDAFGNDRAVVTTISASGVGSGTTITTTGSTPTPGSSNTPTVTNTPTFTPTPTATATPSATLPATHASTATPTVTNTPTFTRTPTPSPTSTVTQTPPHTPTPTATATLTLTATPTITMSPTASATATPTASASPTPPSNPMLQARVTIERRGSAGDPRWVTELFRTTGSTVDGGITVYAAGTNTVLGTFSATTDAYGSFTATLVGIAPGTYDVRVKGSNTLSNRRNGVTVPTSGEIDFGTLLVGDGNGDDAINGADVSYAIPAYLTVTGNANFRPYADTNGDGAINGADISALIPNYLRAGPLIVGSGN